VSVAVNQHKQLMIIISDDGVGLRHVPLHDGSANSHGIGLELCRRIVNALDGELRLTNVPFGQGAVLQVAIPLRSLLGHD
jgi:signal transduction histidine kinase